MTPELSRRLGQAVGTKPATPAERLAIQDASRTAETWRDLPANIRSLVVDIEARPGLWEGQ